MASNFGPPDYMYTMTMRELLKFMEQKKAQAEKYAIRKGHIGNLARQQYEDARSVFVRRFADKINKMDMTQFPNTI